MCTKYDLENKSSLIYACPLITGTCFTERTGPKLTRF